MQTFGLTLFLGYDIAGQLSILFVAISNNISVPNLLTIIDRYIDAGFTQRPEVVIAN